MKKLIGSRPRSQSCWGRYKGGGIKKWKERGIAMRASHIGGGKKNGRKGDHNDL